MMKARRPNKESESEQLLDKFYMYVHVHEMNATWKECDLPGCIHVYSFMLFYLQCDEVGKV